MKKIIPVLALLAVVPVLLASCDWLITPPSKKGAPDKDTETFYANDFTKSGSPSYSLKAARLYEGDHCVVWAETAAGVKLEQAQTIASEYDNKIYSILIEKFSMENFTYNSKSFNDMLEFANWMAGGNHNGKLTILLLDIKDGYTPGEAYTAGYFWSVNFDPKGSFYSGGKQYYSNGRDMIYIDTYPALSDPTRAEDAYSTLAHEAQHLINFVTTEYLNRNNYMDTWIDEGLSTQAEYFYLNKNLEDRCEWFSNDPEETIAKGNNFFVWDNHEEKSMAILDDYATAYLFFRWLNLQEAGTEQSSMFMDIIKSPYSNYQAVTEVAKNINNEWQNWDALLRTWLAANYYPGNAEYGYKGDSYLMTPGERTGKDGKPVITGVKATPIGGNDIKLAPGEGVYSLINGSYSHNSTGSGTNIKYAGLASDGTVTTISSGPNTGAALITFNANDKRNGNAETGSLTGVTPPKASVQGGRAVGQRFFDGSYRIDARDLMGREN